MINLFGKDIDHFGFFYLTETIVLNFPYGIVVILLCYIVSFSEIKYLIYTVHYFKTTCFYNFIINSTFTESDFVIRLRQLLFFCKEKRKLD